MTGIYNQDIKDVLTRFKSSDKEGLTSKEVLERINQYGYNQLKSGKRRTFFQMFITQFKGFMIIILMIAAAISGVVGVLEGEGLLDTFVIMGILILNALIGAFQEHRAESSLEALKKMAAPFTKVLRDGMIKEVVTKELVPGDIVILETGTIVPADMRLIEAVSLKIKESALTGESVPDDKQTATLPEDVPLGDRTNMAFSGGIVTYGRGRGVVSGTGMQTEVGKIADLLQQTEDTQTPMGRRLEHLGKVLGLAALVICAVIFIVGILYGNSVLGMFMTSVSLAVAAIPEGLPAVSTVVLAIGVQRLVKRNAIIRNLPSVETLGSATVICSDKTGTLTQNKMTVMEAYVNHKKDAIDRIHHADKLNYEENMLLTISLLCTDAALRTNEDGKVEFFGDPTETALLDFGVLYGMYKDELTKAHHRVAELPFDSERKRMSTVNRMSDNSIRVNVKGGLEEVLAICSRILIKGEVRALTAEDKDLIRTANEEMANAALRVLVMAYKNIPAKSNQIVTGDLERELIFTGMVGMADPARPEVIDAVDKCYTAGIRPVMITGDHKVTAMAIANEIGILRKDDLSITGSELEKLDDDDFNKNVAKYSVYARVAPEQKVRIVKAWQKNDEVVAMTGDGVNDAPALKQADIGTAMGITGTDVAKGASDMILTDDNFATIVAAVEEGRRIYDNIIKAIQFLLSTNVGEIFLLLVTSVFNMGIPLLPIHILWVNLVTDSLPALALSVDPAEEGIMKRKPRNAKKGFITRGMLWRIMYQGIMIGTIPLVAFVIGLHDGGLGLGQTMAFSSLIFAQLIHVRNLHSNIRSSLAISPLQNKPLIAAILASAGLALIVLFVTPVRNAFSLSVMDGKHWLIVLTMSLIPLLVVDLFKLLNVNGVKGDLD
jgi:Ca2+-transporting ATPase